MNKFYSHELGKSFGYWIATDTYNLLITSTTSYRGNALIPIKFPLHLKPITIKILTNCQGARSIAKVCEAFFVE